MKINGKEKFITEASDGQTWLSCKKFFTVEGLHEYLASDPHPEYRLVSCQHLSQFFLLVWELREKFFLKGDQ